MVEEGGPRRHPPTLKIRGLLFRDTTTKESKRRANAADNPPPASGKRRAAAEDGAAEVCRGGCPLRPNFPLSSYCRVVWWEKRV
jgi:hypothetical protein